MRSLCLLWFMCLTSIATTEPLQDSPSPFDKCRIVTSRDLLDAKAPHFDSYRVSIPKTWGKAKLDVSSNPTARTYRTLLRRELSQGPNFAGHYRIAVWGCGSSCAMFALLDAETGRVITPENFSHTSGVYFGVDNHLAFPESQSESGLFAFRKDSKLLVVLGDLDEDESREGAFYFVLDGERLKLVHTTFVTKDCGRLRH